MLERIMKFGLRWDKLFFCKNHRNSDRRCSVKEDVLKNFVKKSLPSWCFLVKLPKFIRTSIFKNICKRLLLQDITEKNYSSISFTKLGLHNYYYNL